MAYDHQIKFQLSLITTLILIVGLYIIIKLSNIKLRNLKNTTHKQIEPAVATIISSPINIEEDESSTDSELKTDKKEKIESKRTKDSPVKKRISRSLSDTGDKKSKE